MRPGHELIPAVDLIKSVGRTVEGIYAAYPAARGTAVNGVAYVSLALRDSTGVISAVAFYDSYDGPDLTGPMTLHATLGVQRIGSGVIARIASARQILLPATQPSAAASVSTKGVPGRLTRLHAGIATGCLKTFLRRVHADPAIALPFLTLPASRRHHHAYKHGLCLHSLEIAEHVQKMRQLPVALRDIATVGAYFHDVGKIRTLHPEAAATGACDLDHDQLTLEVLAPHLRELERDDRKIASTLRFIWTRHYDRRDRAPTDAQFALEIVRLADRMSAQMQRTA